VRAVADLLASVGIPRTVADLGVPADLLPEIARDAMSVRRLVENNPRPLDEASALVLLRAAHAGELMVLGEALGPRPSGRSLAQPLGGGA
jgi:alcohol dehydrogenase